MDIEKPGHRFATQHKMLTAMFISRHNDRGILHITSFPKTEEKPSGQQQGYIATFNHKKYMIKTITNQLYPNEEKIACRYLEAYLKKENPNQMHFGYNKKEEDQAWERFIAHWSLLREYIASEILRIFLPTIASKVELLLPSSCFTTRTYLKGGYKQTNIKPEIKYHLSSKEYSLIPEKHTIATRSKFLENFIPFSEYDNYNVVRFWHVVYASLFTADSDLNPKNLGYCKLTEPDGQQTYQTLKIDHDRAFIEFFSTPASFHKILQEVIGEHNYEEISFAENDSVRMFELFSTSKNSLFEFIIFRRLYDLKKAGFVLAKYFFYNLDCEIKVVELPKEQDSRYDTVTYVLNDLITKQLMVIRTMYLNIQLLKYFNEFKKLKHYNFLERIYTDNFIILKFEDPFFPEQVKEEFMRKQLNFIIENAMFEIFKIPSALCLHHAYSNTLLIHENPPIMYFVEMGLLIDGINPLSWGLNQLEKSSLDSNMQARIKLDLINVLKTVSVVQAQATDKKSASMFTGLSYKEKIELNCIINNEIDSMFRDGMSLIGKQEFNILSTNRHNLECDIMYGV